MFYNIVEIYICLDSFCRDGISESRYILKLPDYSLQRPLLIRISNEKYPDMFNSRCSLPCWKNVELKTSTAFWKNLIISDRETIKARDLHCVAEQNRQNGQVFSHFLYVSRILTTISNSPCLYLFKYIEFFFSTIQLCLNRRE